MKNLKEISLILVVIVVIILFIFIYLKQRKIEKEDIYLDESWLYADYSEINSGKAVFYKSGSFKKGKKVIAVNAGHGTNGGEEKTTYCHPDKSAKVTGGSTSINSIKATSISNGTTFFDGTTEAEVNLKVAQLLKEKLLKNGYDVLMIRDGADVQLDNIARTVIANNNADIHISIHFDDSALDNGAFYISVPEVEEYLTMYPVSEYYQEHNELGKCLIEGLKKAKIKINENPALPIDLTQTSFSTIPSVDIELGDKKSDITAESLSKYADGLFYGINNYFK